MTGQLDVIEVVHHWVLCRSLLRLGSTQVESRAAPVPADRERDTECDDSAMVQSHQGTPVTLLSSHISLKNQTENLFWLFLHWNTNFQSIIINRKNTDILKNEIYFVWKSTLTLFSVQPVHIKIKYNVKFSYKIERKIRKKEI